LEQEQMIMTFSPGGKCEIAVKGHKGQGCKKLTERIERALGTVSEDKTTAEFNAAPLAETNTVKARA
jgi:hypothetical protein